MQPLNKYYEDRAHKEGHFLMPIIVIGFLAGCASIIFAGVMLLKLILDNADKIDSL